MKHYIFAHNAYGETRHYGPYPNEQEAEAKKKELQLSDSMSKDDSYQMFNFEVLPGTSENLEKLRREIIKPGSTLPDPTIGGKKYFR